MTFYREIKDLVRSMVIQEQVFVVFAIIAFDQGLLSLTLVRQPN